MARKLSRSRRRSKKYRYTRKTKRGGNYAKNITTTSFIGEPIEKNAIITVDGQAMNVNTYKKYMENKAETGDDFN